MESIPDTAKNVQESDKPCAKEKSYYYSSKGT